MKKQHEIVVLYKRSQWKKWVEKFNIEPSSFEEFSKRTNSLVKKLKVDGVVPLEVEIDFDAYLRWVKSSSLVPNDDHRHAFAVKVFFDELGGSGRYVYQG